jgi:hypothetical protein
VGQASATSANAIHSTRLAFTAQQLAFGDQDSGLQLAFERLSKTLEASKLSLKDAAFLNFYSMSRAVADKLPPFAAGASGALRTSVVIEALPSLDGVMAVEAIVPLQ